MVIAVRTEQVGDDLLVVKQARTDGDVARLTREATMLARCQHPGIVELVEVEDRAIRLRHAGTALTRLDPMPLDEAAGVVSAVADVVHSMHRLGVAHGDLDADHVLLDQHGRPRLCGFGRATECDDDAAAADVAALGRLLRMLVAEGAELPWATPPIGLRKRSIRRQARRDLDSLVVQATQADPARRPSARQFAKALHAAVPELHLPTPTVPTVPRSFAALPDDVSPTDDFGWTADDLDYLAHDLANDEDHDADRSLPSILPEEPVGGPERARIEVESIVPPPTPAMEAARILLSEPGVTAAVRRRRGRRLATAALFVLVLGGGIGAGFAVTRAVDPLGSGQTAAPSTTTVPTTTEPTTTAPEPERTPPTWPATCVVPPQPGADVDGDGCPEAVDLDGRTAVLGSVSITLGTDGDLVALGDWDCDGVLTPALLRPSSGEVFVFEEWELDEPVEVGPSGVVPDATGIDAGAGACPALELTTPDGVQTFDPVGR